MEQTTHIGTADFSVYGLLMQADPVVKGVVILLALASVAVWAIILEKTVRICLLNRSIRRLEEAAKTGDHSQRGSGLIHVVLEASASEDKEATRDETASEMRDRRERAMRLALKSELRNVEVGLPFLATVGSAAPFVGLFGTVWGIVNSFTAIAQQKDTSLAVVAPGIAEALIATAIGLAAAIPAVMAYNMISVSLGRAFARGSTGIAEIAKRSAPFEPLRRAAPEPIRAGKRF